MANSTYREIVNRVASLHGKSSVATDGEFDSGALENIYAQIKGFFSLANQMYGRTVRTRFLMREYTLPITSASNKYEVHTSTSPDRLVPESLYITTTGEGKPLIFYPGGYRRWKMTYPEGETVKGTPEYFFIYPQTGDEKEYIGFSPPASKDFSVNYSGYLRPVPLNAAADLIMWPKEFEDVIILACSQFVEYVLAEGKMGDIIGFIEPAISAVEQLTMGPVEDVQMQESGMSIDAYM